MMKPKTSWKQHLLSSSILLFIMLLFGISPIFEVQASSNWLAGWTYRKSHIINSAAEADIGYQVQIIVKNASGSDSGNTVYINNKTKTDFADVRFTEISDSSIVLAYYREDLNTGVNATFSLKINGNLTDSAQTIYIYYGNPTASYIGSGDSTFEFFDDFLGSTLNTTKWDSVTSGIYSIHDSVLDLTNALDSSFGSRVGFWHSSFPLQTNFKVTITNMSTEHSGGYEHPMYEFGLILCNTSSPVDAEISARNTDSWYAAYSVNVSRVGTQTYSSSENTYEGSSGTTLMNIIMTKLGDNATVYWNGVKICTDLTTVTLEKMLIQVTRDNPFDQPYFPSHAKIDKIQIQKLVDPEPAHGSWGAEQNVNYHFVFYGLYDELSGELQTSGVNVTAIYQDSSADTFLVNGTMDYWSSPYPLYFSFDMGNGLYREYWTMNNETGTNIYIYNGFGNDTLIGYSLKFYDLAGVMDTYPYVEIHKNVQGFDRVIERRKVDVEKKIFCSCIYGQLYTIQIKGGSVSYTYGDLLFSNVYSIPLTLKGIEFPQNIILAYKYNRIYAERYNNFSTIKVSYEDTLGYLANVTVTIYYQNETIAAFASYDDTTTFVYTWLMAEYNETYIARVVITHSQYGTMNYNAILYRGGYNVKPWNFPLGSFGNLNTGDIIPAFIIGGCFLVVSARNAYVGGILASLMAILMTIWGWISIPAAWLMGALVFSILLAFTYAKRRVLY